MDAGKHKSDYRFYNGYEGEPELTLASGNDELHMWDGYMEDIFGTPIIDKNGWNGFTRDYNELKGPYGDDSIEYALDINEYLKDAIQYRGREFEYEETKEVLEAMILWFEKRNADGTTVMARVN